MTQKERAQVWARKDQLTKELNAIPVTDTLARGHIREQIEYCDQALVHANFELMMQIEE